MAIDLYNRFCSQEIFVARSIYQRFSELLLRKWVYTLYSAGQQNVNISYDTVFEKIISASLLYFIVALIVGLARVVGGVHFPLDILAGYILGIIIAIVFSLIIKKLNK